MNIIFQDIDGPLIPSKIYFGGNQRPFSMSLGSFLYDQEACSYLRNICYTYGAKLVFNTAHNENSAEIMLHQAKVNGIDNLFHPSIKTTLMHETQDRRKAIDLWIKKHGPVNKWIVIDDFLVDENRQVLIDFNEGFTKQKYLEACKKFD